MRPHKPADDGGEDMFRHRLENVINRRHELVGLADVIDWDRFDNARAPGGMFVLHTKALHGNPYDGHTLRGVIEELTNWIGVPPERTYVDKGYVGHDAPNPRSVYRSVQKRSVHGQIKKELRRRSAVEPVIGHLKEEHRLNRNFLKGQQGDCINAVLAAAGYNFKRIAQ